MDVNLSSRKLTQITSGFAQIVAQEAFLDAAAHVSVTVQQGTSVSLHSRVIAPDGQVFMKENSVSERMVVTDTLPGQVFSAMVQSGGIQTGQYVYELYTNNVLLGRAHYSVVESALTSGLTLSGATLYDGEDCRRVTAQLVSGEEVLVDGIVFGKGRKRGYLYHVLWEGMEGYMFCGEVMLDCTKTPELPHVEMEEAPEAEIETCYGETMTGYGGEIRVKVELQGSRIVGIEVEHAYESTERGMPAIEEIARSMIETNSTDVDVIGGATISSKAMIRAVRDALEN